MSVSAKMKESHALHRGNQRIVLRRDVSMYTPSPSPLC